MPIAEVKEDALLAALSYDVKLTVPLLTRLIDYQATHVYELLRKFSKEGWAESVDGSWRATKRGYLVLQYRLLEKNALVFFKDMGKKIAVLTGGDVSPRYSEKEVSLASFSVTSETRLDKPWIREIVVPQHERTSKVPAVKETREEE